MWDRAVRRLPFVIVLCLKTGKIEYEQEHDYEIKKGWFDRSDFRDASLHVRSGD
jgi:hypothetical protein